MAETPGSDIVALLQAGIRAVKAGQLEQARALLTQVVEHDDRNEQAWLWLSGAVDTDEDRRICLENVLMINPGNAAAQQGLAKLGPDPTEPDSPDEVVMRREHAPNSPAAAILYPDKQAVEWRWRKAEDLSRVPAVEYQSHSGFDDVWNSSADICAYCAQEVAETDRQCPRCQRNLIAVQFRYPEPGASLYNLGALIVSLAIQFGAQTFLHIFYLHTQGPVVIFDAALALLLLPLAVGVYARQRWGYRGVLIVLPVALISALIKAATRGELPENDLIALVVTLIPAAQIVTSVLGLLLAFFRGNVDFDVVEIQQVLHLGQELKREGDFYHTGKRFAERGMWAMAVPYWQRAAATNPSRVFFQQVLGEAYARLGFYERSLDVLEAAARATVDPETKAEIEQLINEVRQRMGSG